MNDEEKAYKDGVRHGKWQASMWVSAILLGLSMFLFIRGGITSDPVDLGLGGLLWFAAAISLTVSTFFW